LHPRQNQLRLHPGTNRRKIQGGGARQLTIPLRTCALPSTILGIASPPWTSRQPDPRLGRDDPEVAPRHRTPPPPAINCPSFPPRTPSIYLISPRVSPVVAFFTRVVPCVLLPSLLLCFAAAAAGLSSLLSRPTPPSPAL
jgi:hypothetical protein